MYSAKDFPRHKIWRDFDMHELSLKLKKNTGIQIIFNHNARYSISLVFLFIFFMVFNLLVDQARAMTSVTSGEYQIRLLTEPDQPVAGETTLINLKILRLADNRPALQGKILVKVSEAGDSIKIDEHKKENFSNYSLATQSDEFGNYQHKEIFSRHATFFISVVISEIEGTRLPKPLKVGFSVVSGPPDRTKIRMVFVFLLFLFVTIGLVYYFHLRRKFAPSNSICFNLLDIPWLKKTLSSSYLQPIFQIPLLISFIFLVLLAFFDIQDGGKNVSTKLIWTIWWAGVIFTFVLVGRMWCFMCPLGAVTELISNGVKATRRLPPRLRNVWLANFLFIILTWVDMTMGIVGLPALTGALFVIITIIAVFTAFFYERRTFCRYLCPIGGLIGIYSLFSPIELRSKDCQVCKGHAKKECYSGSDKGNGCPMFEVIPLMDSNKACNFCGKCIKTCSKNNISLNFRPFFKDAWTTRRHSLDEAFLAIVLVGVSIVVTGEMLRPWEGWMESVKVMVPAELLGVEYDYTIGVIATSTLYFLLSLVVVPGMMLSAAYTSNRLAGPGNHDGLIKTFTTFGYMFIPIGLSMHLAHNTGHLLNESAGIVPAIQRAINIHTPFFAGEPDWLLAAEPLVDPAFLYWVQMLLLITFYVFSLYSGYRLSLNSYKDSNTAFRALIPMAVLSFVLMAINIYFLNLPMAPRHIH